MLTTTTAREVSTPSGSVVEQPRPPFLSRLLTLIFLGLIGAIGILVLIPIALLGLALVISFGIYLFLYRLVSRPRSPGDEGRSPGGEGRQNVRVIPRDSDPP